jgi:hypothetical protein
VETPELVVMLKNKLASTSQLLTQAAILGDVERVLLLEAEIQKTELLLQEIESAEEATNGTV